MEREHDHLRNKLKEKEIELEEKLKERMVEIHFKNDIKAKVQNLKDQIDQQNSITVEAVNSIAQGKEITRLKRIIDNNEQHSKYIEHYSQILHSLENNIETLAQRKPEAKAELQLLQREAPQLQTRLSNEKEREIKLFAELAQL